ncbi:MAG: hypothetical protein R3F53_28995 [Gammaproteobacteria bacterium]
MTGTGNGSQQRLRQSIDLLSQRLDYMEHMLHSLDNAAMPYDLFGHLVFANRAMYDLLKSQAISGYDNSALDLLCRLLDIDQAQGRRSCIRLSSEKIRRISHCDLARRKHCIIFLLPLSA